MTANPGFPLVLDVKGWPVAVIGGDEEASEKSERLLDSGARVTVISPTLNEPLRRLAASGKIIHRGRFFRDADLEHTILVLNTIRGDRDFAQMLLAQAREKGVLLWSVDYPEASSVTMPAVVAAGHVRIAISTSGMAPALSGFIKEDLEHVLDKEFIEFVEWLGQLREQAKADEPDAEKRRALLREALDGFRFLGRVHYPKFWLDNRSQPATDRQPHTDKQ
ncbi:MAG: bifunctional precorrin-2 dehydrogenase/sirohydrochlorin ferrochelatase [Nitrospira sp.]|nr:bifunctional precorrin-2 dehydrogenase/sirohydrochlorin ferrochelatase [Nitrospira sp.]MDR4469329.1 bifunctional precorrin-2 dehydrogenase/sirohydrochlorin ferrochelatase [Nitrospira sp.]